MGMDVRVSENLQKCKKIKRHSDFIVRDTLTDVKNIIMVKSVVV